MVTDPTDWLRSLPWSHIALVLSVALNTSTARGASARTGGARPSGTRAVKGAITRHVHAGPWSGLRLGRRTAP